MVRRLRFLDIFSFFPFLHSRNSGLGAGLYQMYLCS